MGLSAQVTVNRAAGAALQQIGPKAAHGTDAGAKPGHRKSRLGPDPKAIVSAPNNENTAGELDLMTKMIAADINQNVASAGVPEMTKLSGNSHIRRNLAAYLAGHGWEKRCQPY